MLSGFDCIDCFVEVVIVVRVCSVIRFDSECI